MSLFGDINEVRLLGNITSEPEFRYTPNGTAVGNFSVATNRRYKMGEEWKEEVEFHNIVVWAGLANSLMGRVKKGTRVMVVGRLQTRSWDGKDGAKRYKTELIADDTFLIDRYEKKPAEGAGAGAAMGAPAARSNYAAKAVDPAEGFSAPAMSAPQGGKEDVIDPDDLPF